MLHPSSYSDYWWPLTGDHLFPPAFVDQNFLYDDSGDVKIKLRAIEDAEKAYRLTSMGYSRPKNFYWGVRKVSNIVGEDVSMDNVERLRREIEKQVRVLEPPPPLFQQMTRRIDRFFRLNL